MARRSRALEIIMAMDTSGVSAGMRRVSKETGGLSKSATVGSRATNRLRSAFIGAAAAAGGAVAAYASVAQAKEAIQVTQELSLTTMGLRRNLGFATEEASRWAAVTRARGVDPKALTMGFTTLSRNLEGVKAGTESSVDAFKALGVTQKQLESTGGDFSKQVILLSDAFGKAEGSSSRQAAAQKLLGRGYQTLLPMFADGAKGLREQLKWADEFGVTLGEGTVDAMSDFTTAQRRSKVAVMGLQVAFAKHATPAVTAALDKFGEFVKIINSGEMTRAQKLTRLRQEFERLRDDVLRLVSDLAPMIAQSAGEVGVVLAKTIGKAFMETGIIGKVAVTAFVLRSFGGIAAIAAAGKVFGTIFGGAAAAGAATGMAGGAGAAGGILGFLSKVKWARVGGAAIGIAIAEELLSGYSQRMKVGSKDLQESLEAQMNPGWLRDKLRGSNFSAFFLGIPKVSDWIFGDSKSEESAKRLSQILDEINRAGATRKVQLANEGLALAGNVKNAEELRDVFRGIKAAETGKAINIQAGIDQIASGVFVKGDIQPMVDRQLKKVSDTYNRYTPQWRSAVSRTLNAQIEATRVAYTRGGKLTSEGLKRIQEIIARRRKMLASADPIGIARGIANGWKKARTVNQVNVRGFIQRLAKMTPEARQTAGASMLAYARELDAKGKLPDGTLRKLRSKFIRRFGPEMWTQIQRGATSGLQGVDKTAKNTGKKFDDLADKATNAHRRIKRSASSVTAPVRTAYQSLADSANSAADAFGSNQKVKLSFRRGGQLNQPGSKRLVPAAVSPGELISYKNREMYVPGRPEPRDSVLMYLPIGAKVFTSDGQRRLASGASETEALRRQAPHFNTGGIVGDLPSPKLTGGGRVPTATGQAAIDRGRTQAQKWIERLKPSLQGMEKLAAKFGLERSSGYRPGDDGYHGVNRARDFSNSDGPTPEMLKFAKYVGGNFGQHLLELIYTPLGWAIKNGAKTAPYAEADHYDHVHVALRNGGKVTAKSPLRGKKRWGANELHTLASAVGMSNPGLMAQIAQGESGGRAKLNNAGLNPDGTVDYGLWQINSIHGKPVSGMLNPIQNALYAKELLRTQGLNAWVAYYTGRYAQFSPGRFDEEFYWDLIYPDKAQDTARRDARRKVGRAGDLGKKFRKRGGTRGTGRKIRRAAKNARKALRLAKLGNVGGSVAYGKKSRRLAKQAASGINPRRMPDDPKKEKRDDGKIRGLPGFKNLPPEIKSLLKMPGLSIDDKVAIYERAATIAAGTPRASDDEAVRQGQIALQTRIRRTALRTARRASRFLDNYTAAQRKADRATLRDKDASKKAKRQARRRLNRLGNAPDTLNTALNTANSAESELAQLRGESEASTDLATAMKELAEAIKEQNQLQSSVQATSSREALRMLSDVISGQIVGKRTSVTQPVGVRY